VPLAQFRLFSISFGENRAPATVWIVAALVTARWLKNLSRDGTRTVTLVLNRVGAVLVLLATLSLATSVYASGHTHVGEESNRPPVTVEEPKRTLAGTRDLPDIYYIILDDYARGDVLRDLYACDN